MIDKAFLEGIGITDAETVKQITDTYAADIQAEKDAAAAVQTQLETANTTIQSYKDMDIDGIKQSAADWQKKYEDAEKERKAQAYSDGLDKFVQKQGMRNDIYAAHLKQQLSDKQLKFDDNGVLLGGDDVVKALRESCPDAFANSGKNQPHIVEPSNGGTPDDTEAFRFNFLGVRPHNDK